MLSLYSLKCLFFPVDSVCRCFFFGDEEMSAFRSCCKFPPSNSIHLLPRIDSIQLEVSSLLFLICKICLLFEPFLYSLSFFKLLVTFPFFPLRASCAYCHFPTFGAVFCFMDARTSQIFLRIFRFLSSVL